MKSITITAVAALALTASAYNSKDRTFAVNHFYGKGPLTMGRMDPIINPGTASGHVHAIQGGNAFALTMGEQTALGSTCTSSLVKADKSNYWTPSLYFQDPKTGELESVDMYYMNVYYFFEPTTDTIKAFPPGLRMVVGDPSLRSPPATGGKQILDLSHGTPQPIQWTCPRDNPSTPLYESDSDGLHGVGIQDPGNAGAGVGFSDKNCDGYASPLRADIHFPSCYNPAAGLDDYKNNMQFPTNNNCPEGWTHTPHLFYEVYWNTLPFQDRWTQGQGKQPWVLANGDPTGYGLHGDFIAGWDVAALQQIIDNCDAGDHGMDQCPGLMGGLNDPSTSCNIASAIDETISGNMTKLPGNNPIGEWGVAAAAAAAGAAAPASSSASSIATSVDQVVATSPVASSISTPAGGALTSAADSVVVTMVTKYTTSTTQLLTTTTASSVLATSTATAGGGDAVAAGFSYYGCWSDTQSRVLTGIEFANVGQNAVTNTKCTSYCGAKGYSMAGTEYGGQCFCGNSLAPASTKLGESSCDMACEGDTAQTCGGGMALSIYTTTTSSSSSAKRVRGAARHLHQHLDKHR